MDKNKRTDIIWSYIGQILYMSKCINTSFCFNDVVIRRTRPLVHTYSNWGSSNVD